LTLRLTGATIPARERPSGRDLSFLKGRSLKEIVLTKEGYTALKKEIEELSTTRRREVAERIKTAREFGDIAENAEYDSAKNEQAMLEARIAKLEERLAAARVIEKRDILKDVVSVGSTVRLRDVDAKQTVEYRIVGSAEANPAQLKLSNESPVGKAIMGHKKGETVEVTTPRGSLKYKILEIKAA
jgi:transcription elongation factor GreA